MNQMKWQRSVIREEMDRPYQTISLLELGRMAKAGDEEAKREWSIRWEADFPNVGIKNVDDDYIDIL